MATDVPGLQLDQRVVAGGVEVAVHLEDHDEGGDDQGEQRQPDGEPVPPPVPAAAGDRLLRLGPGGRFAAVDGLGVALRLVARHDERAVVGRAHSGSLSHSPLPPGSAVQHPASGTVESRRGRGSEG